MKGSLKPVSQDGPPKRNRAQYTDRRTPREGNTNALKQENTLKLLPEKKNTY